MDLKTLCTQACIIAGEAGEFIRNERLNFNSQTVEVKSFNQLVSYVDKTAEELLVKKLGLLLPEAGFITEEETITSEKKEYMWVIDPTNHKPMALLESSPSAYGEAIILIRRLVV